MQRIVEEIEKRSSSDWLKLNCEHAMESTTTVSIGDEINCPLCDQLIFPHDLVPYKKTPVFNQDTVPKGLRRAHSTKNGVWALITVLSGKVRYVVDYLDNRSVDIDTNSKGVIAPQMLHHLDIVGDVELYVEFYTKTKI